MDDRGFALIDGLLQVDQEMLFEIILAANYLDIKPLLYVCHALDWLLPGADLSFSSSDRDVGCKTVSSLTPFDDHS